MKKFKLIKEYPHSFQKGTIANEYDQGYYICLNNNNNNTTVLLTDKKEVEKYPEFWKEIVENAKHIKQPLFTTEDGVDIFEGNNYFGVNKKDYSISLYGGFNMPQYTQNDFNFWNLLTFSTKEKAEEFIIMNKPCLSYKDVCSIIKSNPHKIYQLQNSLSLVKIRIGL